MNAVVPYIFFIYIFLVTWIMLMNYERILDFSSGKRSCFAFISIIIALVTFVGIATIYNIESRDEDYKEKIKDVAFDMSILYC